MARVRNISEAKILVMSSIMKNKIFTITGFVLAIVFWFFDSSVHYFIYGESEFEFIPSDFDELWMRAVIAALFSLFGIFADFFARNIMIKEKQWEVVHVYNEMLHASSDVLDNLLDQMQLFKSEALRSKDFDQNVIKLIDESIKDASRLVDTLSNVEDMTDQNSQASN